VTDRTDRAGGGIYARSMNRSTTDQARTPASGRRFPAQGDDDAPGRRFAPDKAALKDALHVVRGLDADSYQALLWALGLTPDERLSVPGCARRRAADPPA
jgi:hypothetical protein